MANSRMSRNRWYPNSQTSHKTLALFAILFALNGQIPVQAAQDHLKAGTDLFNANHFDKAIGEFATALRENPTDAAANYYLAVALVKTKRVNEAAPYFEAAQRFAQPNSQLSKLAGESVKAYGKSKPSVSSPARTEPEVTTQTSSPPALVPSLSMNGGAGSGLYGNTAGRSNLGNLYNHMTRPSSNYAGRTYGPNASGSSAQLSNGQSGQASISVNAPNVGTTSASGPNISNGQGMNGLDPLSAKDRRRLDRQMNRRNRFGNAASNPSGNSPTGSGNIQATPTTSSAANTNVPQSNDPAARALRNINEEAQEHISNSIRTIDPKYEQYGSPEKEIAKIRKREQSQVDRLENQVVRTRRHGTYYRNNDDEIDQVRRTADADINEVRRVSEHADAAKRHADAVKNSADALSDQIVSQHLTGSGIRLMPDNTNLHVRNYETYHSDDDDRANVAPLIAKPKSLQDLYSQTFSQKGATK